MRFLTSLPVLLLAGAAIAAPVTDTFVQHEKREDTASRWIKRTSAPSAATLPLRISLRQRNAELGHDHLMDISNPRSANFGKYWTADEIASFFAPKTESVDAVREWLGKSGISPSRLSTTPGRGSVTFYATVDEAEKLLNTKYHVYEDEDTGDLSVSCEHYSLHHSVRDHIDFITPTIGFARVGNPNRRKEARSVRPAVLSPKTKRGDDLSDCDVSVTPECVRALYGIPSISSAQKGNELGIFESGDYYDQEDLDIFFSLYTNITNGTAPIVENVDTTDVPLKNSSTLGGESLLDLELAIPLIYPQQVRLFQTLPKAELANNHSFGLFDLFLDALDGSYCTFEGGGPYPDPSFPDNKTRGYNGTTQCGVYSPPNVISISYGLAEAFYTPFYVQRQCQEYMKLGLQGVSIIVSSGDNGTAQRAGLRGCLNDQGRFNPVFPGSCPYVTTVGATMIKKGNSVHDVEVAALNATQVYTSGGGFSNVFAQPSYQSDAVKKYLNSNVTLPNKALYNATSRAYPDVAAVGEAIAVITNGTYESSGGTSASAPIFASIITLINEKRLAAGKKSLGFLNPTLYQNADAFTDVTEGFNYGCHVQKAFEAGRGWDPVTGLGTPKYSKLEEVLLGLP